MPDVREYQSVVEEAELAAGAGDFARANACLRDALQIQESTLGPTHPDLASTLNNLAVVCETVGDHDDAERFYRRAYAIASGSLPPGDPLVATSRDNLKDFCAARGRPFDEWPGIGRPEPPPAPPATAVPVAPAVALAAPPPATPTTPTRPARSASAVTAPPADAPWSTRVIGVVALLAVVGLVVVVRSWRTPALQEGAPAVAAPPAAAAPPEPTPAIPPTPPPQSAATPVPVPAPPPVPPTTSATAPPATTPAAATLPVRPDRATGSAPAATPAGVRVVAANVCASLSTSGAWRCDAVDGVTAPGRAAFYTRIASPSAMRVQHRWYHGTSLRQSVTLSIAANPSAGYRTFSRQTLSPGAWRVELRAADGSVLHEAAFDVR